jgi:hypothetical protein
VAHASSVSTQYFTIEDLAEPPQLLIVKLGVKAAANREMANVLNEALLHRLLKGKPTWVIDQPSNPLRMNHICWSGQVQATLDEFQHLWLDKGTAFKAVQNTSELPEGVTPVESYRPAPSPRRVEEEEDDNDSLLAETLQKGKKTQNKFKKPFGGSR